MVRTHLVELSKAQTATGHISSNYGVMSSAILSFKTQISAAITDEVKTSITSKISSFEAVVQENYSSSLDVKEKEETKLSMLLIFLHYLVTIVEKKIVLFNF